MAEVELDQVLINIVKCKQLHGVKGPNFSAVAKVEFGNQNLGESPKLEVTNDNTYIPFNFTATLNVSAADPTTLDELAQTPIVVTVSEILPKDKKAKEEKSVTLGQCCVDLLPLLRGDISFSVIEQLHPVGASLVTDPSVNDSQPEIEIVISTAKCLLSDEQLQSCNLMTVCIESAYSLPESWTSVGNQFMYAACMPLPITEEKETLVLVPNGHFRGPGEKESNGQRKWSMVPSASGSCLYIPNTAIHQTSYQDEDGDLRAVEDVEFRLEAENQKAHVTWNSERRCFMSTQTTECFRQKIANCRYWPLEVIRTSTSASAKSKGKEEEVSTSFHGIAYIDLAPLLYPGINKIRGAYKIQPYMENEVLEKVKRKGTINESVIRMILGAMRSASGLGNQKAANKGGKGDNKTKSTSNMKGDGGSDVDSSETGILNSMQYRDARTYIILEIELEKPLVNKRKPQDITQRLASMIPPRDPYPKKQGGSKKVISDFEKHIEKMGDILLEEFRSMYGCALSQSSEDAENRKRSFLYELNTSGKYFALKEQLKYYIIKIVREKYMYTKDFESPEKLQEFISILYRELIDHMHVGLNKFLSTEEVPAIPKSVADKSMLFHFAKEAESLFQFDLAATYYQERIATSKLDCKCWLDYGMFCLLIGDITKAEECFRQVVALDQNHMIGVLMNGVVCLLHEEYERANEYFEILVYKHPKHILAWTLHGLHFSGMDNSIMSERSFNEAKRLLTMKKGEIREEDEEFKQTESYSSETDLSERYENLSLEYNSIYLSTAKFLLDSHCLQLAERALSHELLAKERGPKVLYLILLARLKIERKEYDAALNELDEALSLKHDSPDIWSLKGHVYFVLQKLIEAKECYERCLAYTEDAEDINVVYLRLAMIYCDVEKQFDKTKMLYLRLCRISPSSVSWLGVGKACYRLDNLSEAEQALNEANILENKNALVWAYLTLVCLKSDRHLEAEQCYKYAIKLGINEPALTDEIKETMIATNFDMSVL